MDKEELKKIRDQIDSLLKLKEKSLLIAIDGRSAAGKSSLAQYLKTSYDCNIFHMDDFFLRPEQKTHERLRETGGNVDYERFKEEVIRGLISEDKFSYSTYNCQRGVLDQIIAVDPKKLNIIEGSYSLHPTLIENYDLKVFLDVNESEQSLRILERNGEFMHRKFMDLWIPLENDYFSSFNIKEKCQIIIDMSTEKN